MSTQIGQDVALAVLSDENRRRTRNWKRLAMLLPSALIVTLCLVAAIFADLLMPYDPKEIVLPDRLIPPAFDGGTWDHPLGTDQLGRDILARTMHGAPHLPDGRGHRGPRGSRGRHADRAAGRLGWVDKALMRFVDMQLAFPALLFVVLVAAVWGPTWAI